jgi:hypothetical protein
VVFSDICGTGILPVCVAFSDICGTGILPVCVATTTSLSGTGETPIPQNHCPATGETPIPQNKW